MHVRFREKPFGFEKPAPPNGELVIIEERCKGCGFCVEYCPNDVLEISNKYNSMGYHPPEVINEDECRYCGFCQLVCPEFAIFTVEEETEIEKQTEEAKEKEKSSV
jgi:2-oxoglutarate ferredoxin oxidoreductase subunit delta